MIKIIILQFPGGSPEGRAEIAAAAADPSNLIWVIPAEGNGNKH